MRKVRKAKNKESEEMSYELLMSINRAWEDLKHGRYQVINVNQKKKEEKCKKKRR